jgi:AraC-like DNA-binding protein
MHLDNLNPTIHSAAIYDRSSKRPRREERVAYDARLFYVFSGEISCAVKGEKPISLTAGSLVYLPAGTSCAFRGQYMRVAVIAFDPSGERRETTPPVPTAEANGEYCRYADDPFDKVIHLGELESVWDDVERICDLGIRADEYSMAKAEAILKLLLVKIAEATDAKALPLRMTEELDEYIREHAGEEISNTEIGAIFGYHPFYVSTVIKEKRGMTLRQYVISYRLKLAVSLLEHTDKTIAEIAEVTGFTDASYFTKSFKAAFGETPKEWRAKCAEDFI